MSNYQDHLLFGAVLVFIFSYFIGPYMSYGIDAVIASAAFILLAAIFPDIDHRGSIVHQRLRALITLLVAAVPVMAAYPYVPYMIVGGILAGAGTYYAFEYVKPKHRGVTHTLEFCALFSVASGLFSFLLFSTFFPAVFTFIAYMSHLILDGTIQA